MKALGDIELALSRLGIRNRFWGRPEIKELRHVLTDDEIIINAANGRYENGFCLLVATDRRLLLIDRKLWFLSMEDVRFDMITELDYCARLVDATLSVRTINKVLRFTSFKPKNLRELTTYLQARVMELRHIGLQSQDKITSQYTTSQPLQVNSYQAENYMPEHLQTSQPAPQQFYSQVISRPRPLKRIGAYPTASLTMQRRF